MAFWVKVWGLFKMIGGVNKEECKMFVIRVGDAEIPVERETDIKITEADEVAAIKELLARRRRLIARKEILCRLETDVLELRRHNSCGFHIDLGKLSEIIHDLGVQIGKIELELFFHQQVEGVERLLEQVPTT